MTNRFAVAFEPLERRELLAYANYGPVRSVRPFQDAGSSDLAVAGDGSYVILSTLTSNGTSRITASRLNAGLVVGDPIILHSFAASGISNNPLSVAMDADGDAVAVYQLYSADETTDTIVMQRISRSGVVSSAVTLATITRTSGADPYLDKPTVAMDDAGQFTVGWLEANGSTNTFHFRAFDADGSPRAAEFTVPDSSRASEVVLTLDLSVSPDGTKTAFAYASLYADSIESSLFVRRLSTTAATGDYTEHKDLKMFSSDIEVFNDGRSWVGYERRPFGSDGSSTDDVDGRVQRFDANGAKSGTPIQLGTEFGNNGKGISQPVIHRVADGGFVTAYLRDETVYAQRYSAGGVSDDAGPQDLTFGGWSNIRIGARPNGDTVVSFIPTSGTDREVHHALLTSEVAAINGSRLFILGTAHSEAISVKEKGGSIYAAVGHTALKFAKSAMNSIEVVADNGNDLIVNLSSRDIVVDAGRGNDTVHAGVAGDFISGKQGDDALFGNVGRDLLFGREGNDLLKGNDGNDFLSGDEGNDRLYGQNGADEITGNDGHDTIYGGAHRDVIFGNAGDDRIFAESGDDYIDGGDGRDLMDAGDGNDRLVSGRDSIDTLIGGTGSDMYHADYRDSVSEVEIFF